MNLLIRLLLFSITLVSSASVALADQEAGNVANVSAGPYGRCYAKSIPDHDVDPQSGLRQQGRTDVLRVSRGQDELVESYDWFSGRIFVLCHPIGNTIIRLGSWHRGHDPQADHLAIAFYQGGNLIKSYSTLDISGPEKAQSGSFSAYENVSASVSHYTIFSEAPKLVKTVSVDGVVFTERWVVTATTVDGRVLVFDPGTGEIR